MSVGGHVWTAPSWQGVFATYQHWSLQPCVRPVLAIMPSADQVPVKSSHSTDAVAQVGCPDRRIDRLCITPFPTFTSRRTTRQFPSHSNREFAQGFREAATKISDRVLQTKPFARRSSSTCTLQTRRQSRRTAKSTSPPKRPHRGALRTSLNTSMMQFALRSPFKAGTPTCPSRSHTLGSGATFAQNRTELEHREDSLASREGRDRWYPPHSQNGLRA
jgi:hypothetical protein